MIRKVCIQNYRRFREFDIEFQPGINVLVGCNGSGKSTLIEAIDLALTGRVQGRFLTQGISPYLINLEATRDYFQELSKPNASKLKPPEMIIDVFLDVDDETGILTGDNNIPTEDAIGVRILAKLSEECQELYQNFLKSPGSTKLAPTEYYKAEWLGFSGQQVNSRAVPASTTVIDPSMIRLQAGVDYHLQQVLTRCLDTKERVELSRQYRGVREEFNEKKEIEAINKRLDDEDATLTGRKLSLAIDISQRYTWESNLAAHLDDIPLHLAGQGDQNALKTLLAIGRRAESARIVLLEEPETRNKKYQGVGLADWVQERSEVCTTEQRNYSYRSNQAICDFADAIYPDFPPTTSIDVPQTGHDGVFQIEPGSVPDYVAKFGNVTALRHDKNSRTAGLRAMNFGVAKGSTFERILIFPTEPMLNYLKDREPKALKSPEDLYVAVTRARFSVAFVVPRFLPSLQLSLFSSQRQIPEITPFII